MEHLQGKTALHQHSYDGPHLTSQKTEAQRGEGTDQGHTARWCRAEARTQVSKGRLFLFTNWEAGPKQDLSEHFSFPYIFQTRKLRLRGTKGPAQGHRAIHMGAGDAGVCASTLTPPLLLWSSHPAHLASGLLGLSLSPGW